MASELGLQGTVPPTALRTARPHLGPLAAIAATLALASCRGCACSAGPAPTSYPLPPLTSGPPEPSGPHWRWVQPLPTGASLADAAFTPTGALLVVGSGGTILRSIDGGVGWARPVADPSVHFDSLWIDARARAWALGTRGELFASTDDGTSWRRTTDVPLPEAAQKGASLALGGVEGTLVVVGPQGAIRTSSDGGATWTARESGTMQDLHGVWASEASGEKVVYAIGREDVVLVSRDAAATWSTCALPTPSDRSWGLQAVGGGVGEVVVLTASSLLRAEVGTCSFTSADIPLRGTGREGESGLPAMHHVTVGDDGFTAIAASDGQVFTRDPRGVWSKAPTRTFDALRSVALRADAIVAVGDDGALVRSSNRGAQWSESTTAVRVMLGDAWGDADGHIVVVGEADPRHVLVRSDDAGTTWSTDAREELDWIRALDGKADELYAVGVSGKVARSGDAGRTWAPIPSGVDALLQGVWVSSDAVLYAVGSGATIVKGIPREGSLALEKLPSGAHVDTWLRGVWGRTSDDVFVVGADGVALHTIDGGRTWQTEPTGVRTDLHAVGGTANGDVFAVGDGVIVQRAATGTTWTARQVAGRAPGQAGVVPPAASTMAVAMAIGPDGRIDVATGGNLYTSRDQGTSFALESPGAGVSGVWRSPRGPRYAFGPQGAILAFE